jgi:membrane associated rhomboid family serine protease
MARAKKRLFDGAQRILARRLQHGGAPVHPRHPLRRACLMLPLNDHNPSATLPLATWLLIAANVACFFLEMASPDLDAFLKSYALVPQIVNFGRPHTLWPFFTSMFLHAGWVHLISNMWFLRLFGDNAESYFGRPFYALVYVASGLAGGLTQYAFAPDSSVPMLGASGAIAGVLGAYIVLFPNNRVDTLVTTFYTIRVVQVPAIVALGYWFATQLFSGVGALGAEAGVAYFAHVGGFVAGVLFALIARSGTWFATSD